MTDITISKSQYIKGLQCHKAFWLARKRKDLGKVTPEMQALFDAGEEIGKLAQQCYPDGVAVTSPYWDVDEAIHVTRQFVNEQKPTIFEATAMHPKDGSYCRIDILQRVPNSDQWDMLEVKSSTGVKDYHYDDLAFQYRVFTAAGYNIRKCELMLINNKYVRNGSVEPEKLFYYADITQQVIDKQAEVEQKISDLIATRELSREPMLPIGSHCASPFECVYKSYCWAKVPGYSVFNLFSGEEADEMFKKYGADIQNIPEDERPGGSKAVEMRGHLMQSSMIYIDKIRNFLAPLKYPLYFLDYETVMSAIPLFDGTRPYQKIPFQFSLHRQDVVGDELHHSEYLHREQSDPRLEFIKNLLNGCGDEGSIVVYNKAFETSCNNDLARCFPEYADDIHSISHRFFDLLEPFGKRWIYNTGQNGSASLKSILPAFTDLSYENENISSGGEAMRAYTSFLNGQTTGENLERVWRDLLHYCKLDTYAMVKLLEFLQKYTNKQA